MRMNKTELTSKLAADLKTSKLQAGELIDAVLRVVEEGLREDGSVVLTGFGTFLTRPTKARVLRNPNTGEAIPVPPGTRVAFRSSPRLKHRFN